MALFVLSALLLTACAQKPAAPATTPAAPAPATPAANEPWTLEKAAEPYKGQRIAFWTPTWKEGLDKVAAEFKAKTGIEVEVTAMPNQQLFDKFILDVKTGQGAFDAAMATPSVVAAALKGQEGIVDLSKFMKNAKLFDPAWNKDDVIWDKPSPALVGEKVFGVPANQGALFLYYRKDLFADPKHKDAFKAKYGYDLKPPATIKELGEVSTYFTETEWKAEDGTKGYGIAHFGKKDEGLLWEYEAYVLGLLKEGGAKEPLMIEADYKTALTTDAAVKALEFYKNNLKNSPPGVFEVGNLENRNLFAQGKVAMVITFQSFLTVVHDPAKSKVADKVAVAQVPGHRSRAGGGWHATVNAKSKYPEAAYLWIQYLTSKDVNWQLNELSSIGLNRYSNWTDPRFLKSYPYGDAYDATFKEGYPTPSLPEYQTLHKAFGEEVSAYFASGGDAKTVIQKINDKWTQTFKEAGYVK